MDLSALKSQITTIFMMKQPADGQHKDIFVLIYGILLMSAMEVLFRNLPAIGTWVQAQTAQLLPAKALRPIGIADAPATSSVTLVRSYAPTTNAAPARATQHDAAANPYVEKVDAVIQYLCGLDAARHIRMDTRCSLNTRDEIQLTPLIKARVQQGTTSDGETTTVTLFSDRLSVSRLQAWIDEIHEHYVYEKANKLGNRTFYFNEVAAEPTRQLDPRTKEEVYRLETAPAHLTFTMNEFRTAKSFANVFGDHVTELRERLDLFLNRPEWYMERGIPHCLGILLHGIPGAGKTSTIKAIAHDTNRHIVNLSLRPWTTQKQLMQLFFDETVSVSVPGQSQAQTYKIPLNRRVYVIEDIDCLTDVVLDREWQRPDFEVTAEGVPVPKQKPTVTGDAVTLSFLLNLLDGVLETPGRILVITTNYPERLDRALIRPGRIDVRIGFGRATRALIRDMVQTFYTCSPAITVADIPTELEGRFTPAEVMEALCTNFKDYRAALAHLQQPRATPVALSGHPTMILQDIIQHDEPAPAPAPAPAPRKEQPISFSQLRDADMLVATQRIETHNRTHVPDYTQFVSMYSDMGGGDGLASLDAAFTAPTFTRIHEDDMTAPS
jgi:hypothetical protein